MKAGLPQSRDQFNPIHFIVHSPKSQITEWSYTLCTGNVLCPPQDPPKQKRKTLPWGKRQNVRGGSSLGGQTAMDVAGFTSSVQTSGAQLGNRPSDRPAPGPEAGRPSGVPAAPITTRPSLCQRRLYSDSYRTLNLKSLTDIYTPPCFQTHGFHLLYSSDLFCPSNFALAVVKCQSLHHKHVKYHVSIITPVLLFGA